MGTTAGEPDEVVGITQRLGKITRLVDDRASHTAYGTRGGSLWPLSLVLVAGVALLSKIPVVGVVALLLLAIWIGGRR